MIWIDGNHVVKWECKKDYKAVSDNIEANLSQALSVPDVLKQSHICPSCGRLRLTLHIWHPILQGAAQSRIRLQ